MIQLENYLSQLREQGESLDSGDFSLNPQRAKGKLANFQLTREMGWASLLLQAAVMWQCPKLELVQTRHLTRFVFPFKSEDLPGSEDILKGLTQIDLRALSGLNRFVSAVQVLLHQAKFPFQIKICRKGEDLETLAYGELSRFGRLPEHPVNTLMVDINHKRPLKENLFSVFLAKREQMAIRNELEFFGTPSPIPILLDGQELVGRFSPSQIEDQAQRILVAVKLISNSSSELPNMPLPAPVDKILQREPDLANVPSETQGFFTVNLRMPSKTEELDHLRPQRRSHICWVQAGVVLEAVTLDFRSKVLCFDLYLSSEGLKTDLTGFQLIRDQALRARELLAFQDLRKTLEACTPPLPCQDSLKHVEIRDHKDNHPVIGSALFLTLFAPMMAIGTVLCLLIVFIPVGLPMLGAGWLGYKHQPFKLNDERVLQQCVRLLEEDLRLFWSLHTNPALWDLNAND